ncbi:MAG: tRNA-dihydrouridine synthase [Candidatus Andersenbacteria bacterium]
MMWSNLSRPIMVLAPMDDVTDVVFRDVVAREGRPDVFFTEFTNCDALFSEGRQAHIRRLQFTENHRPIVAQIWGPTPENYYKTARLLGELGFDAVDINMGCPQRNIIKSGSCGALIQNHSLAQEIIAATKEGAGALPVSVKTRLGYDEIQTEDWIGFLLNQNIAALTIHGRTVAEMSSVPAHWDEIQKAVELRDAMGKSTLVMGNGDIESLEQAHRYVERYGVDGVMIGRGIFKNLWLFNPDHQDTSVAYRIDVALSHAAAWEREWGQSRNFEILKKFLKIYIADFPGAAALRATLMETHSIEALTEALEASAKKVLY